MESLQDPVSAWLSGIGSSVARALVALLVVLATEALLYICCSANPDASTWLIGVFLIVAMPFWWLGHGGWAVIGLLSAIGILVSIWAFMNDHGAKSALFAVFTFSIVYFWPAFAHGDAWHRMALAYGGVAFAYWGLPRIVGALLQRRTARH